MCRYGMTAYKPHFACFECRKTFKRRLPKDIKGANDFTLEAKCPQCGGHLANMGLDFESPKMKDLNAWNHIKDLYSVGITFHSCGCSGPGYIPRDKVKLIELFEDRKTEYIKNLRFWLNRIEPTTKQEFHRDRDKYWTEHCQIPRNIKGNKGEVSNSDAIEFWTNGIAEIEQKISSLKQE